MAVALKETSHVPTRWWKESHDMCIHFDTILECDGQTDGQRFVTTVSRCADARKSAYQLQNGKPTLVDPIQAYTQ